MPCSKMHYHSFQRLPLSLYKSDIFQQDKARVLRLPRDRYAQLFWEYISDQRLLHEMGATSEYPATHLHVIE